MPPARERPDAAHRFARVSERKGDAMAGRLVYAGYGWDSLVKLEWRPIQRGPGRTADDGAGRHRRPLRNARARKKNGAIADTRVSLNNHWNRRRPQPAITSS
jgi:hypothetical protein